MSRRKGNRRERQAQRLLEEMGYEVSIAKNHKWGANDYFNLYDILAVHPEKKPKLIQVKSNGTGGALGKTGRKSADLVNTDYIDIEYWVCYDYDGWKVRRMDDDGEWTVLLDERDEDANMGEHLLREYR